MSSVSSRNSSYADSGSRYPSGMTNLTAFSSDSASFFPSGAQPPRTGQQLSEDQFDIINSLDYDDVDDGLIGTCLSLCVWRERFLFSQRSDCIRPRARAPQPGGIGTETVHVRAGVPRIAGFGRRRVPQAVAERLKVIRIQLFGHEENGVYRTRDSLVIWQL